MGSVAFMLPVLHGREQTHAEGFEQLLGRDGEGLAEWLHSLGFQRHAVWHQKTPGGTVAIVLVEADDPSAALGVAASSDDPVALRHRALLREVHGIDFAGAAPPPVTTIVDWRA